MNVPCSPTYYTVYLRPYTVKHIGYVCVYIYIYTYSISPPCIDRKPTQAVGTLISMRENPDLSPFVKLISTLDVQSTFVNMSALGGKIMTVFMQAFARSQRGHAPVAHNYII